MSGEPVSVRTRSSWSSLRAWLGRYVCRPFRTAYGTRGLLARVATDLLMANLAFYLGYVISIFYQSVVGEKVTGEWVRGILLNWIVYAPLFTVLCLLAFIFSGLYGPKARGGIRHRIAFSFRAVGLAYLVYVFVIFLIRRSDFPASALLPGLVLSLLLVTGARVGKQLFSKAYIIEPRLGPKKQRVEDVLVIGGAGYIGSALVRKLLDSQYRVRVLDSLIFGDEAIRELYTHSNFELLVGDFRNLETIVRAVRGMDAVVHLGAIVGDPACALDKEFTLSVNTHAVRLIRDICCGYGVSRFLFASTCSVYGAQHEVINEQSRLAPVSLYAQSKIEAEQAILEKRNDGFNPTILRLATAFGLSPRMRFDLVANLLTARALRAGKITIFNGDQWRPFIHVNDIALAFLTCLEAPLELVAGQVFNAGDNNSNLTLKGLGEAVGKIIPTTKICHEVNSSDARSYRVDFSKITQRLGFRCRTTVEEGIVEMAQAIRAGRFREYEHIIYNNAAYLKSADDQLFVNPLADGQRRIRVDVPVDQRLGLHSSVAAGPV